MRMRRGQTLVEYALILALISIVAVIVLQSLGQQVTQVYSTINNRIEAPSGS
jgi:Flp pilus assembly pilin Flp